MVGNASQVDHDGIRRLFDTRLLPLIEFVISEGTGIAKDGNKGPVRKVEKSTKVQQSKSASL